VKKELKKLSKGHVVWYTPSESDLGRYRDGGVAIIDQWIAAHGKVFVGTLHVVSHWLLWWRWVNADKHNQCIMLCRINFYIVCYWSILQLSGLISIHRDLYYNPIIPILYLPSRS